VRYTYCGQRLDILWMNATTDSKMGCYPTHVEFVGQRYVQDMSNMFGP
jgi:hypothetical protein